jgi:N-glycosylase/DNA lyase
MAISSIAHGSQTATVDTEHALSTQTTAGVYILVVDMSNLANGDVVVLRIKVKAVHDGSSILAYMATFAHAQIEPAKFSVPVPVDTEIVCTLEQTDGTGRAFPWNLLAL